MQKQQSIRISDLSHSALAWPLGVKMKMSTKGVKSINLRCIIPLLGRRLATPQLVRIYVSFTRDLGIAYHVAIQ